MKLEMENNQMKIKRKKNEKELIWAWMKWGFKIKLELVIGFLNFGLGLSGLVVSGLKQGKEMGFVKRKGNSSRTGEKWRRSGTVGNFISPEL